MNLQQVLKAQYDRYYRGIITYSQFAAYVMAIARQSEAIFNTLKAMYNSGEFSQSYPIVGGMDTLADAYDDWKAMAKIETANIMKQLETGKITREQAESQMKKMQSAGDAAWDELSWYQKPLHVTDGLTDFFGARWQEVKNVANRTGKFAATQSGKLVDTTAGVVRDVSGGVKSIGEGAGSLLKAGGFIIPVVIGIAGLLVYKLVTSDTGKAVAATATRRFT